MILIADQYSDSDLEGSAASARLMDAGVLFNRGEVWLSQQDPRQVESTGWALSAVLDLASSEILPVLAALSI